MRRRYSMAMKKGVAAALALAVFSIAEYILSNEIDNPTWYMVPFMFLKGWVILDMFMHVRALKHGGSH